MRDGGGRGGGGRRGSIDAFVDARTEKSGRGTLAFGSIGWAGGGGESPRGYGIRGQGGGAQAAENCAKIKKKNCRFFFNKIRIFLAAFGGQNKHFPPRSPPFRSNPFPPPEGQKTTPPPRKLSQIPPLTADPSPTYGRRPYNRTYVRRIGRQYYATKISTRCFGGNSSTVYFA